VKNFACCRAITAPYQLMRLVKYVITIIGNVLRKIEELNERWDRKTRVCSEEYS